MPSLSGLNVSDLVAGYDRRPLARMPSLDVAPGEAALLLGPSGSGKTTLLLAIAGMAQLMSGSVTVDGEALGTMPATVRDRYRGRHIGLVFQDFHLIGGLSALDNILLAPFASGAVQQRDVARTLLGSLGLAHRADARARTLSRGEAQRVAIARAVLQAPRLLLADEPTASLDDVAAATVLELLMAAARDTGAALVIATHDSRLKAVVPHQVVAEAAA